jgi:hypothetical protein
MNGATVAVTPDQREIRNLKRHLKGLTVQVMGAIARIDALMKQPESVLRGKQIAEVTNALEMTNDGARYFGLGVNFRTDKKLK